MNYNELINIRFLGGIDIEVACTEATELATNRKAIVSFDFNGIKMEVHSFDVPKELVKDFYKKIRKN